MKPLDQIDSLGSLGALDTPARGLDTLSRLIPTGKLRSALAVGLVEYAGRDPRERRIAVVHATANALALGCQAVSLNDRLRRRLRRGQWTGLAGTVTLAVGGLLGGHLAHRLPAGVDAS